MVLIFISSLLCAQLAGAQEPLGQKWKPAIETLIGQGVTQIGHFDLREFQAKAKKVCWKSFSGRPDLRLTGNRRSAFFKTKSMEVRVNDQLPSALKDSLPLLELHEALGATGYHDENYSLSTALQFLSELPKGARRNELLTNYGQEIFNNVQRSDQGSGTSVGGGGDLTAIAVKYAVLKTIVRRYRQVNISFLSQYPKINFEPFYEKNQQFVALRYQILLPEEKISVYIPAVQWIHLATKRPLIVDQVLKMVTEIFPVNSNVSLHRVSSLSCDEKNTGLFPKATLATTLVIQQARVNYLSGCEETTLRVSEVRSPAFKTAQELFEATGIELPDSPTANYKCTLTLGRNKYPSLFKAPKNSYKQRFTQAHGFQVRWKKGWFQSLPWVTATMMPAFEPDGRMFGFGLRIHQLGTENIFINTFIEFQEGGPLVMSFRTTDRKQGFVTCERMTQ